jgi:hypothetical protein
MRDFIGELGYFGKQLAQWSFGLALVLLSLAVISPAHLGFAASAGLFGLMMLGGMCGYMLLANAIPPWTCATKATRTFAMRPDCIASRWEHLRSTGWSRRSCTRTEVGR